MLDLLNDINACKRMMRLYTELYQYVSGSSDTKFFPFLNRKQVFSTPTRCELNLDITFLGTEGHTLLQQKSALFSFPMPTPQKSQIEFSSFPTSSIQNSPPVFEDAGMLFWILVTFVCRSHGQFLDFTFSSSLFSCEITGINTMLISTTWFFKFTRKSSR